jgi:hypothetical protein
MEPVLLSFGPGHLLGVAAIGNYASTASRLGCALHELAELVDSFSAARTGAVI